MTRNPLDIRTILTQVHTRLTQVIELAFAKRYPEAADLAALAAYDALALPDRALVWVSSEGVVYRWLQASLLPELLPYVVAPLVPLDLGNGRWVRESSSVTLGPANFRPLHRVRSGYLQTVQIYEGQTEDELDRIYAQRPAVLVELLGDELKVKSYAHGAIYQYDLRFSLHALAVNLRNDPSVLIGSDTPGELEPGLYQLIGDLRYLLGGCKLGLEPGVMFTDITGAAQIVETMSGGRLSQRAFSAELPVLVRASVHVVDEDLEDHPEVWVQRLDAGTPVGQSFDAANHVAAGYKLAPQQGLTAAPSPGAAYLHGQLVSSIPAAHSFAPSADTYRDLALDGRLIYSAVAVGEDPPPQPAQTLRVGLTRTSASAIESDVYLCCFSVPSQAESGDPFRVS